MKISKSDIQGINRKRSARNGKIYSTFEGNAYIGQKDGTLVPYGKSHKERQQDKALEARVAANETDIDNLEKEDELIKKEISNLECKFIGLTLALG